MAKIKYSADAISDMEGIGDYIADELKSPIHVGGRSNLLPRKQPDAPKGAFRLWAVRRNRAGRTRLGSGSTTIRCDNKATSTQLAALFFLNGADVFCPQLKRPKH